MDNRQIAEATPIGRYMFENAPPAPPHLAALARPFVDRASLRYKGFRQDLERIQSAAVKAIDSGELAREDATLIWLDVGHVVSIPLIGRYLDAREFEQVAAWLRARAGFQCADWPDEPARVGIEGFVGHGEGALAAALCRGHLERLMKSLRQDWKERRRKPPKKLDEAMQNACRAFSAALVERIPRRNAEMMLDIAAVEPVVAEHGSAQDRAAVAAIKAEVGEDQRRFPGAPQPL